MGFFANDKFFVSCMGCLNDFLSFKEIVFLRVEWGPHVWKILSLTLVC